jgi:hypothetical protein
LFATQYCSWLVVCASSCLVRHGLVFATFSCLPLATIFRTAAIQLALAKNQNVSSLHSVAGKWVSSKPSVLRVDDARLGKVRAVATGDATVTFNGSVASHAPVTVARVAKIQVRFVLFPFVYSGILSALLRSWIVCLSV